DAGHVDNVADIDVEDPGVGVRAAQHRRMQSRRWRVDEDVVDVAALAAQETLVLDAGYFLAEQLCAHRESLFSSAARCTAPTMFRYPVHRQRLPATISRASSSVGAGSCRNPASIVVMKPGVQKPHCSPWHSRNACCTHPSDPSGLVSPSTVVISWPSAATASTRQDLVGLPSI